MRRIGAGPVFSAECLTASRRVPFYAARSALVAGLLVGVGVVWLARVAGTRIDTLNELAAVGGSFYTAMMGVELVLALMIAPAATAGAICQDRARGGLALMMTTDLSDAEIVLGRLASRLLAVLGVVACGMPVLALATLMGGVDPVAVAGGTMVVVGVAVLGVGMAMALSLWAGKPHEALSATYAIFAVWLLALLAWDETIGRPSPRILRWTSPFWLLFSDNVPAGETRTWLSAAFLGGCLLLTAILAGLATWRLRSVALRRESRAKPAPRRMRLAPAWLRRVGLAAPALDDDPVLWREWHRRRPSGFGRAIWWTYAVLSVAFTVGSMPAHGIAPGVCAFMVSIGLLLASVGAATALAEERSQGSLDVVLATPVDSRSIVLAKWRGAFRVVPRLAILPAILAMGSGLQVLEWGRAVWISALVVGLVLAYGAVVVGLGLVIAIVQPRTGRAVAIGVGVYLLLTVGYPAAFLAIGSDNPDLLPLWGSPFFGAYVPMANLSWGITGPWKLDARRGYGVLVAVVLAAGSLLGIALATFDRGLGRVPDRPRPDPVGPGDREATGGGRWTGRGRQPRSGVAIAPGRAGEDRPC